jgi:2',3'-cyclic-nucleotide 2'-phosphodiesterase (5'-nucleotidase family)
MGPILRRFAIAALALLVMSAWPQIARSQPTNITFLHVNDVYEIAPKGGQGGFAELMTLLRRERATADFSITTFGGDLISPSVLSSVTEGAHMIELMNLVGMELAVPGNHEFDFGPEVARQRFEESRFTWLGTNVLGKDGKPAVGLAALHTVELGGFTIGFFGLLDPQTESLSAPGPAIAFAPVKVTALAAVKQLRAMGAEIIVALTHLDFAEDVTLARDVPGIHLILGGHDHEPIAWYERSVPLLKAGTDAHHLGAVDLKVERIEEDGETRLKVAPSWRLLSTAGVDPDPEIEAVVAGYMTELDATLDLPVGVTEVKLVSRRSAVRTEETRLGNLIADAMRDAVGAEVAIIPGGGIRGDRTYETGTTLTRKDILAELPFGNVIVMIELSGADLLAALENGVSQVEDKAGRFPQVSGLSFVYDLNAAKGSRVVEATVAGEPLEPGRFYKVATSEFLRGGGDGYVSLKNGKVLIDAGGAQLLATTVMDYIAAGDRMAPRIEGRILAR